MIAALYVQRGGIYWDLPGVDPWDEERDARLYDGPWPVVAHPPCARWCQLAGLVEARYGIKQGEDGGCFEAALRAVRTWGGVLEHPAYSRAWHAFGLPVPDRRGGWQMGLCGGWSCHVEQRHYGHRSRKATWIYAFGVDDLPSLKWGRAKSGAWVSWCGNHNSGKVVERLSRREGNATPEEFRDVLIAIARSCEEQKMRVER